MNNRLTELLSQYPKLQDTWISLSNEFSETPRIRYGAWVILAVFVFYIGLSLQEYNADLLVKLENATKREQKSVQISEQDFWLERQEQSVLQYKTRMQKFNLASTAGAAKATLQEILQTELLNAGFRQARVNIQQVGDKLIESIDKDLVFWSFNASIRDDFNSQSLERFLLFLNSTNKNFVIERLEIGQQRKSKISLNLKYWFIDENAASQFQMTEAEQQSQVVNMAGKLDSNQSTTELKLIRKGEKNKKLSTDDLLEELMKQ